MIQRRSIIGTVMVALVLALVFTLACVGQEPISRELWQKYQRVALNYCETTPTRRKVTIDDRKTEDDEWRPYSKFVIEIIASPYRFHAYGSRSETIQIGKIVYSRQGDGPWSKKELEKEPPTKGTVEYLGVLSENYTSEKRSDEDSDTSYTQLRDGEFTVLRGQARTRIKYLRDGLILEHDGFNVAWFDNRGRFVKTESVTYEPRRKIFIRRVEEYEYDTSIKIEAPIPN